MYSLTVDADGADAITFAGYRYQWSDTLESLGYDTEGIHDIPEHEAWELNDAFQADTEGGHGLFPSLAQDSKLAENLFSLIERIV